MVDAVSARSRSLRGYAWVFAPLLFLAMLAIALSSPGTTKAPPPDFDAKILHWLRGDPRAMHGPGGPGVDMLVQEITALGSFPVAAILIILSMGGLWILERRREAIILGSAGAFAWFLSQSLKHLVGRLRPDAVTHLVEVTSPSFPSGHAFLAAFVYPTLAYVWTRHHERDALGRYVSFCAMVIMAMVGFSRLYLGVHYITDVLGGWALGLSISAATAAIVRRHAP